MENVGSIEDLVEDEEDEVYFSEVGKNFVYFFYVELYSWVVLLLGWEYFFFGIICMLDF